MMKLRWMIGFLLMMASAVPNASAAPIDELIAAAKKGGTIEFFAAGTLGAEGAQKLGEAFNKKYGLSLKTIYHPSSGMARDIGKR
jgi:ABC-type glycerol-3-phosphate transport system substrate-binding protein